jgi:hypothetical protein
MSERLGWTDDDKRVNVAQGWARTPNEAKQIAEEWEQVFRRYEMPFDPPATTQ